MKARTVDFKRLNAERDLPKASELVVLVAGPGGENEITMLADGQRECMTLKQALAWVEATERTRVFEQEIELTRHTAAQLMAA